MPATPNSYIDLERAAYDLAFYRECLSYAVQRAQKAERELARVRLQLVFLNGLKTQANVRQKLPTPTGGRNLFEPTSLTGSAKARPETMTT